MLNEFWNGGGEAPDGYAIDRSLRFNSGDSAYLDRTPSSAGNQKTWTWSGWVKISDYSTSTISNFFFGAGASDKIYICQTTSQKLQIRQVTGGSEVISLITDQELRDTAGWGHLVVAVDTGQSTSSNRIKVYWNGSQVTSFSTSTYPSQNLDTHVNSNVSHTMGKRPDGTSYLDAYLADIHFIDGQSLTPTDFGKYDTNNVWQPKEFNGTSGPPVDQSQAWSSAVAGTYNGSNVAANLFDGNTSNQTIPATGTSLTFTPSSAVTGITKIRIKLSCDPLQTDEFKVNGVDETSTLIKDGVTRDQDYSASQLTSIVWSTSSNNHWIALKQISVEVNGSWVVLVDSGVTIPNNSFHLDFSDNSSDAALGTDSSGNGNDWTVNNLSVAAGAGNDALRDSPVNGDSVNDTGAGGEISGNYAILSSVHNSGLSDIRLSEGGLKFFSYTGSYEGVVATIAMTQKTYWETKVSPTFSFLNPGIIRIDTMPVATARLGISATEYPNSAGVQVNTGTVYYNGSSVYSTGAWSGGDIIGHAYDPATGNYYLWKNGTALNSGNPVATLDPSYTYAPAIVTAESSIGNAATINFGQRAFDYGNAGTNRADASYKTLCTANLPDPTIADGSTAFDASTWSGTGSAQSITTNMSPDLVWVKDRGPTPVSGHKLEDIVRGAGKYLSSNTDEAEVSPSNGISSFNANGYTLGTDNAYNATGHSYVGWAWDAGSSNTTIAVGSLNSSAYNQDQEWSNYPKTGTQPPGAEWTEAFNGNLVDGVFPDTDVTTTLTIDVADRPAWSSSIRIYGVSYGGTPTINGIDVSSAFSSTLGWFNLTSLLGSSGTLASLSLQNPGGNYAKINAVELDGRLLVDTSVTLANVPAVASTVRANPSAGFSIVSYTGDGTAGATIGHGLNSAPSLIIVKELNNTNDWQVYFSALGATKWLYLNSDIAAGTSTNRWNNTEPTSTVFTIGDSLGVNRPSSAYISYCFAPVEGYSAFGSYTGNGSTDGPFVFTGFRPRWVMWKPVNQSGTNWVIRDAARDPYNVVSNYLLADTSGAEGSVAEIDILSNGFKFRNNLSGNNTNGVQVIYVAFAEHPFKTSRAR